MIFKADHEQTMNKRYARNDHDEYSWLFMLNHEFLWPTMNKKIA
jgi:hypothetical protein